MRASLLRLALASLLGAAAVSSAHAQPVVRAPAADRALPAPGAPLFSVGRAQGSDAETFARVAHAAFDAAGNLYVLDQGRGRVVVFDGQGRFVRQVGRPGRGPGELLAPMQVAVLGDGTVVVSDLGRRAFAVFGARGEFRAFVPFATQAGVAGLALRPFPGGGVITVVQQLAGVGGPGASAASGRSLVWQPLEEGRAPATLFRAQDAPTPRAQGGEEGGRATVAATAIFAPRLHFGVFPGGALAVAHTAEYRIAVTGRGPSTPTARFVERPLQPRRVTAADRERAREREMESLRSNAVVVSSHGGRGHGDGGMVAAIAARQVENLQFADVIPVIQALGVDAAGRMWVQRAGARVGEDGPIDLLTEQGAYLGTLSGVAMPVAFGPGRAAWVEADAEGVQRVVVRALPAWR